MGNIHFFLEKGGFWDLVVDHAKKTASKGGSGETFHCFNFKCYYDKKRCSPFSQLLRRNFKNKSDFLSTISRLN